MTDGQRSINSFSADTHTETVVQTVVLDLETSEAKNKKVTIGIEEFQRIAGFFGDIMPSIPEYERTRNNPAFYNLVKREFADSAIKSSVARDAAYHAIAMYDSHSSNGSAGDRPDLGNGSFMQLCSQDFEIADNGSGYGLKASFIPYDAVWFGISLNPHTEKYLRRVFEDEAETGSCELHLSDDGDLRAHVAIKWEVEVYEAEDVSTVIGVDIGENVLYSVAAVDGDSDVESVEMESGAEFRHYREQFKQKRTSLMEKGDLRALSQCRDEHRRYTEQTLDTASRRVVEFAVEHEPSVLVLEDLTHYRETADDPIHDWPFADLQEKICYKATAEGIPVETVDPKDTSITCRKCGQATPEFRDGTEFSCRRCGYEVHADVNAAINIAKRYAE
jgi:IS605 OrfB family transposase